MHLDRLINVKSFEKVVFFLRRHPITFAGDLLLVAVLAAIPVAGYFVVSSAAPDLLLGTFSRPLLILFASAYSLTVWVFFLTKFVDFYLDAWIVTNDKILNIEQQGLFSRTVSELDLSKVQDVTSEVKGVIPSLFNYGDVFIQTAGEKQRFVFEQIPRPHDIRKHILELVEVDRKRQGETTAA